MKKGISQLGIGFKRTNNGTRLISPIAPPASSLQSRFRLPRLWPLDCGLRTVDCGLWTMGILRHPASVIRPLSSEALGRVAQMPGARLCEPQQCRIFQEMGKFLRFLQVLSYCGPQARA